MQRSNIVVLSLITMVLLAVSLNAYDITVNIQTNRQGNATVKFYRQGTNTLDETHGPITIYTSSNNSFDEEFAVYSYRAELEAWNGYAHVKQTRYFSQYTGSITFDIDLSGTIPDNPPDPD